MIAGDSEKGLGRPWKCPEVQACRCCWLDLCAWFTAPCCGHASQVVVHGFHRKHTKCLAPASLYAPKVVFLGPISVVGKRATSWVYVFFKYEYASLQATHNHETWACPHMNVYKQHKWYNGPPLPQVWFCNNLLVAFSTITVDTQFPFTNYI